MAELNYNSLLEYWIPPAILDEKGIALPMEPVSFICTTFTFDTEFFEEQCLSRFLKLETEKENDGVAYLIEKEEKLSGLSGGIVLVDQHHCKGERNLRWDLTSCRVVNGIQHSKIVILQWSHCIRVIVGSANVTRPGYCMNQEIFGVFDYSIEAQSNPRLLDDLLNFVSNLVSEFCGEVLKKKFEILQAGIKEKLALFKYDEKSRPKDDVALDLLLVSPENGNGLKRLRQLWDEKFTGPPDYAWITSPFFDEVETKESPSKQIFDILKQRGTTKIHYQLAQEAQTDNSTKVCVAGPAYLVNSPRSSCEVWFKGLPQIGTNENGKAVPRPLHRKSIWLESPTSHMLLIGSSNFTSAAFGLGRRKNFEANLIYSVHQDKAQKGYKALLTAFKGGDHLTLENINFQSKPNGDEAEESSELNLLPLLFNEAVFRRIDGVHILELSFNKKAEEAPIKFSIGTDVNGSKQKIFDSDAWETVGRPETVKLDWTGHLAPDLLLVRLNDLLPSIWPVIVENQLALPPVKSLRELSLNTLIAILSSSQPLHRIMAMIGKAEIKQTLGPTSNPSLDPHKQVDTSSFILQRTRRVSNAFQSLVRKLEKPVFSMQSLQWRLYGPIGAQAFSEALKKEAHSDDERVFLLSELALELSRVNPESSEHSLSAVEVKAEIGKFVENNLHLGFTDPNSAIEVYGLEAYKTAMNEF